MIIKKNLVLIGMMGSGKSTIGSIIAKRLKFEFIDIDMKIEKMEKRTIKKIFQENGEKYFRDLEEIVTLKQLKLNSKVISLGGGGFLNSLIRKEILKQSLSFWLNWNSHTLIKRIINKENRPLVINLSRNDLLKMIKSRSHTYKNAHYKIDCDNLEKNEVANKIIEIYENK
mgnify:FL=1|tara:strand:- start:41 stop:553 length:513 start_codon:yes stop_codon:yes gene_type:complete